MEVYIKGKGKVSLSQADFLAKGGQGSVYGKGKTAFKIYENPNYMFPVNKIQELSVLTNKFIIKPEDILLNDTNTIIGYTMPLIKNTYALCQLFPKAFRQRENLSHPQMFELIKKLQGIVKHCHDNKILIVDLNEMNFLTDDKFQEIYAIDTDSYQTPSFPATAIMDSIKDLHSPNHFDEGTDWFSFAVTAMQMFTSMHPYKGQHPKYKTVDERKLKNISILNKEVSVPPVCYDFSVIPPNYMNFFHAVLEEGKRLPPPFGTDMAHLLIPKIKTITGNNKFDIQEIHDYLQDIYNYFYFPGNEFVIAEKNSFFNDKPTANFSSFKAAAITPKKDHLVLAKTVNEKLELFDVNIQKSINCNIQSDAVMSYNGILYNKINGNIVEISFIETGNELAVSAKVICQTMENATWFFDGVSIQNMLKSFHATVFPKAGSSFTINIKELKDYVKIIDAKYDNKVLMVVARDVKGKTDQFIIRINDKKEYDLRKIENITFTGINFITLEKGMCVSINHEEKMELFSNEMGSQNMKIIDDPIVTSDMKLYRSGTKVLFATGSKLYSIKMK